MPCLHLLSRNILLSWQVLHHTSTSSVCTCHSSILDREMLCYLSRSLWTCKNLPFLLSVWTQGLWFTATWCIQVPADASGGHVTITCHFNQTGSTEVQVIPAAAAQPSGTASQTAGPPIDDLTDDFAAGDAAVQIPVRSRFSL